MGNYDYNTRKAIRKEIEKELEERIKKIPSNKQMKATNILLLANTYNYRNSRQYEWRDAENLFRTGKEKVPSEYFKREYQSILDAFVPKNLQKQCLIILDKLNLFPYSLGWHRRTVRTSNYWLQFDTMLKIIESYVDFFYLDCSPEEYIRQDMDEEKIDYKNEVTRYKGYFIAAAIDSGDTGLIAALKEAILSENNNIIVTREMIDGIFKSSNEELHKLVGDLLLAARLQEGLRQTICETADRGTIHGFKTIIKVIEDNNLIRYSSVNRAASTWIGICDENNIDRVNQKILSLMSQCLDDKNAVKGYLKSEDSIELSVALWAEGFYEVTDAMRDMDLIVENGSKHQVMTMSVYNSQLGASIFEKKIAGKAIEKYPDDMQIVACFIDEYLQNPGNIITEGLDIENNGGYSDARKVFTPRKIDITKYFKDADELERHYRIFVNIYNNIPKKKIVWSPCIFPWYAVRLDKSKIIQLICLMAYMLEDEDKIEFATTLIKEIGSELYSVSRPNILNLLLYNPKNDVQKTRLIEMMGSSEGYTSTKAIAMVKRLSLSPKDYETIKDMLRFKRESLRNELIGLLMLQDNSELEKTINSLLKDKKEEKRTAGLDMIMQLSLDKSKKTLFEKVKMLPAEIEKPTSKEKVLIDQLTGEKSKAMEVAERKGFGLYNPEKNENFGWDVSDSVKPKDLYKEFFPLKEKEIISILQKMEDVIEKHKDYEYESDFGEEVLFGNTIERLKKYDNGNRDFLEAFPLSDLFREFYDKEVAKYEYLIQISDYLSLIQSQNEYIGGADWYKKIFGKAPYDKKKPVFNHISHLNVYFRCYMNEYRQEKTLFERSMHLLSVILPLVDSENKYYTYESTRWDGKIEKEKKLVRYLPVIRTGMASAQYWKDDKDFTKYFKMVYTIEENCKTDAKDRIDYKYGNNLSGSMTSINYYDFIRAYDLKLINENTLIMSMVENFNFAAVIGRIANVKSGEIFRKSDKWQIINTLGQQFYDESQKGDLSEFLKKSPMVIICKNLYDKLVPVILTVELSRGDSSTVFSSASSGIDYIEGLDYLVAIIKALGKDTLDRGGYYYWAWNHNPNKKSSLSHLLKVCHPLPSDNGKLLGEKLKGTDIENSRLAEVAMYAPQWIDIIEDYLGWKGMKSGCYYFMAHMNEAFDDRKKAIIARYTPLSDTQLQDGAFDINWFREAYKLLGKGNFAKLYNAAKYIADGNRHTRARKYADAATGVLKATEVKKEVEAKRNKDLLMSYGLIPLKNEKDLLARYEYIQQFKKESKTFGSMRQTSEGKACEMALMNLSINAGYSDVTRLTLNMETKLMEQYKVYLDWKDVEDVKVRLVIDHSGHTIMEQEKGGKKLKSLPAKLKKKPYILEIKEVQKKLRAQYSRTKQMMEDAMENRTPFKVSEISALHVNPIAKAIIKDLVFKFEDNLGFVNETGQMDCLGKIIQVEPKSDVVIAHPLDMFKAGNWHEFQKYIFDKQIKQSFKQVFRELYVKLEEEMDQLDSRMFAGNQIQPAKTVGCLKGRKWIADYEEGLQKVYYEEDVVARIYALADWFSPSDVEEPTLEWVEFSNRRTYERIKIKDVPDIIYSEVMRDVDLAVSVAHAGGVDPETSHSTIEMRRAIVEFNLPLFGFTNVQLKDSHAIIKGTLGEYSVHLGSGVVHQIGGAMLNILPVHSQKRGKLFLPFVDADPKTAEIMSKIVLFAEDSKIKDPTILSQIK